MRVLFQQADLDTCLTALLVGVGDNLDVRVVTGDASPADIADPAVVCIEAGGSGQAHLANYDHHGVGAPLDPACVQALANVSEPSPCLRRLVQYVAEIDCGRRGRAFVPAEHALTLSSVFSGMRLCTPNPVDQFRSGLALLREVLRRDLEPAGPMPELPEWRAYVDRKRQEWTGIAGVRDRVHRFTTSSGLRAGFLETEFVGALGLLYEEGCDVAIAYSPHFQSPSGIGQVPKFSVGCRAGLRVDGVLAHFSKIDPGWGGPSHGTIIGSPRGGSALSPSAVCEVVRDGL